MEKNKVFSLLFCSWRRLFDIVIKDSLFSGIFQILKMGSNIWFWCYKLFVNCLILRCLWWWACAMALQDCSLQDCSLFFKLFRSCNMSSRVIYVLYWAFFSSAFIHRLSLIKFESLYEIYSSSVQFSFRKSYWWIHSLNWLTFAAGAKAYQFTSHSVKFCWHSVFDFSSVPHYIKDVLLTVSKTSA